jgi:hypothetical protein
MRTVRVRDRDRLDSPGRYCNRHAPVRSCNHAHARACALHGADAQLPLLRHEQAEHHEYSILHQSGLLLARQALVSIACSCICVFVSVRALHRSG